ncbi:MAG: winged helix-turn-helix domain-containing protein [Verrucomicrobiales bacterium]|nr:winged helix-turn-helix domain-containing protein [Verrucomicrobiales bacterium]
MRSADLTLMVRLLETREELEAQVARLDRQLAAFEPGSSSRPRPVSLAAPRPRPAQPAKRRRAKRGALTATILRLAQQAGNAGVTVKELAAKLGLSQNRVFNWFYATGKHVRDLQKIGEAHYAWMGTAPPPPRAAAPPRRAPPHPSAPGNRRSATPRARDAKPGQLKDSIIQLVKAAGQSGVTVREIASELALSPQRVYVWFNGTAKSVPEIQKLGPATYRWID